MVAAGAVGIGGGAGSWALTSLRSLWQSDESLCRLVDPTHPHGLVPLMNSTVQPVEPAEMPTIDITADGHQIRLLCASVYERDAWLGALRDARHVSSHRICTLELAKEKAEETRDQLRKERDECRAELTRLSEEHSAYDAASKRLQTELDSSAAQRVDERATDMAVRADLQVALDALVGRW